ncbi:hypothetical protein FFLO_05814 [Filobasidium floriforme]|uniref:Integrase catalytic domain-containing protein n=1 Tax=Filobasidium floriforme TaxID=5210 RepID=A0A8K0NNL6_9TREE|nr:hypothetical protein FFLO_05814 [Filobasidium floriforme]
MDDVFFGHDDFDYMLATLETILKRASKDNLRFSPEKTFLFMATATIGGAIVSSDGVSPDPEKVAAIVSWPRPRTARDVLSFVNTAAVFRSCLPNFAEVAKPLYDLTKDLGEVDNRRGGKKRALDAKDIEAAWGAEEEKSFARLKTALTTFPIVVGPTYDGRAFHVACDASVNGFGAHLYQLKDDGKTMGTIAYASRGTSDAEKTKHSSELEMICAKWALDKFDKYTYGMRITLHTDCQSVRDLLRGDHSIGNRAAWKEAIAGGRLIDFVHRAGKLNAVADGLSRNGTAEGGETRVGWETEKGLRNGYVDFQKLSVDQSDKLLTSFADDAHEDIVRWLFKKDVDRIDAEQRDDVARRSNSYWVDDDGLHRTVVGYGGVKVIPTVCGPDVAMKEHESNGHLGRDLCLNALRKTHYWTSMRKDVDSSLAECPRCVRFGTRLQRLLLKPVMRYSPFSLVAMDFVSMPVGHNGLNQLLVAVDCFTRYVMVWTYKGAPTGAMVIKALEEMRSKFITPAEIITDNGSAFNCNAVLDWGKANKCEISFATPYSHVGLVENANHLVLERLRRLANADIHHVPATDPPSVPKKWPQLVQESVRCLNERNLEYMGGFSPKDLLFGPRQEGQERGTVDPGRRILLLDACRSDASASFVREQLARKGRTKEWNAYHPSIGDTVLAYDPTGDRSFDTSYKLKAKWQGPFVVCELGRRSARLKTLEGRPRAGWISWNMLKEWKTGREGGRHVGRDDEAERRAQQHDNNPDDSGDDTDTDDN